MGGQQFRSAWPLFHSFVNPSLKDWQKWLSSSALCGFPSVIMEIRDSSQIFTTAHIFLLSNHFRQKYLASCAISLLNNIWVWVEHTLLQQLNLQKVNCSSSSLQDVNKTVGTNWTLASKQHMKYFTRWKNNVNYLYISNFMFTMMLAPVKQARKARRCDSYLQIWSYEWLTHWLLTSLMLWIAA